MVLYCEAVRAKNGEDQKETRAVELDMEQLGERGRDGHGTHLLCVDHEVLQLKPLNEICVPDERAVGDLDVLDQIVVDLVHLLAALHSAHTVEQTPQNAKVSKRT
jgi:hypothetical protein